MGDRKGRSDFRIFDPEYVRIEGWGATDYNSLGTHPQAILFEGWFDRNTWEMDITFTNVHDLEPQSQ